MTDPVPRRIIVTNPNLTPIVSRNGVSHFLGKVIPDELQAQLAAITRAKGRNGGDQSRPAHVRSSATGDQPAAILPMKKTRKKQTA